MSMKVEWLSDTYSTGWITDSEEETEEICLSKTTDNIPRKVELDRAYEEKEKHDAFRKELGEAIAKNYQIRARKARAKDSWFYSMKYWLFGFDY